jgi:HEAT repeat protein
VEAALPPDAERPRRLEGAARKILAESGLLRQEGKLWTILHPIFADYLTACHLAADEAGQEILEAHIDDPTWLILTEFYAGLTDAGELADQLLSEVEAGTSQEALLRAARWGIVAPEDHAWRKHLIKVLAQTFMQVDLDWGLRLSVGHALSLIAGEGARAFFLRMLRQPSTDVRCAAIRGLGWAGTPKEMPLLAAALRDSSSAVQSSAVDALRDSGTDGAIAFLAESMPQVDEVLMIRIAEALASLPAGWDALESATEYPDLLVRRAAAQGLGLIEEAWAEQRLLEIGREDVEWLVRSAAEAAIQTRQERDEQQMRICASPKVDQMAWLIAWAARQGQGLGIGEAARETLLRAAQEGNVDAKALSALTLAQIGRRTDLPLVEVLARDRDPDVQRAAAWATQQVRQRYGI